MVTFEVDTNRELPLSDGTGVPFVAVLFSSLIDADILDANGNPIEPSRRNRKVLIGDPVETRRVRLTAPNFVFNMLLGEQNRRSAIPGEDGDFIGIVEGSAFLLNGDGTVARPVKSGEFLKE